MSWQDVQHHYVERDDAECPHGLPGYVACPECELETMREVCRRLEDECQRYHDLLKALVQRFDVPGEEHHFYEHMIKARKALREGIHATE